jgi:hypothetical protein
MNLKLLFVLVTCTLFLRAHPQSLLRPGTVMQQTFLGSNYKDSVLTEYTYTIIDSTHCRTDEITWWSHNINPEVWIEQRRSIYTYDYLNRLTKHDYRNYNAGSRKWSSQQYHYTYANNLLHSMYHYQRDDQGFNDKITYTYSYDTENKMTKSAGSIYLGKMGYSHPLNKTEFHYDELGRRSIDSIYNWSIDFYPMRIINYTYDEAGRLDSMITMPSQFTALPYSLSTYAYSDNGLLKKTIIHKLDSVWIPEKSVEYIYDSTQTRRTFEIQKTWNPLTGTWVDSGRIKNEEFCTDELVPTAATEHPLFRLYPNPGNELRLLPLADIRNLNTITVMDIRGVVIFTDQFQWPHLDELRDRSRSIPNGFYFVSITSENYRQDLKWIKAE